MPRVFFVFISSSCKASTWQNNYLLMFNFYTLWLKRNNSNSIHGAVSWKWVSHRTAAGESSVWISSTSGLKFGKSLPFTVSLFLFLLPALPLVCHFWKAAMSLCTSAAQSTAVLQTQRPWGTSKMQHGKIHCELDRVVFCHPVSRLHGALRRKKSCWKPQDYLQNRALFRMNERGRIPPIIYFVNTWEPTRNRKFSDMYTPCMNTHREGAHTPP